MENLQWRRHPEIADSVPCRGRTCPEISLIFFSAVWVLQCRFWGLKHRFWVLSAGFAGEMGDCFFTAAGADEPGAVPVEIGAGNHFPGKYQKMPRNYCQYWCWILVKFLPFSSSSVLVLFSVLRKKRQQFLGKALQAVPQTNQTYIASILAGLFGSFAWKICDVPLYNTFEDAFSTN